MKNTLDPADCAEAMGSDNIVRFPDYENALDVAMATFIGSKLMGVDEMFDGFDDLKVVTYSYELGFIERIAEKFESMTVLLGCEALVGSDMRAMAFASQHLYLQQIQKHKKLYERALKGTATFKVAHDARSHQKIYIMTAGDGRQRVLVGSPNFTGSGFSGLSKQGETFVCFDNDDGSVKYFLSMFNFLDDFCMDEIPPASLKKQNLDDIEVQDLPVARTVKERNTFVVVGQKDEEQEIVRYALDMSKLENKYKGLAAEVKPGRGKRTDKTLITPQFITELTRIDREKKKMTVVNQVPKLHYDYVSGTVSFNGSLYDLQNISEENVKGSFEALLEYFDGFSRMQGDVDSARRIYYKLAVFMLPSPFIGQLRYVAGDTRTFNPDLFSYFAMIHGRESAGKTQFVQMMQHIMTGKDIKKLPTTTWTKTEMNKVTSSAEGVPLCIDEMDVRRFTNHADEIIKDDEWLFLCDLENHPMYVVTTNRVESIDKPLRKRMYYVSVPVTMDRVESADGAGWLKGLRQRITPDLYKKYLSMLIPTVEDMITLMQNYDPQKDKPYSPDIYAESSRVILAIAEECGIEPPDYMTKLEYSDYFGYNDDRERVTKIISLDWQHDRNRFLVSRKKDELVYRAGETRQDAKNISCLLPSELCAEETSGGEVVMKLNKAEEFFGMSFKKGLFS